MACNLFRWQVAIFGCSKVKIVLCTNPRTETIFGANVAQNMVHLIEELFSLTSHIYPEIYKKTCIVNKPNFKPNIEYVDSSRKIFRHYQVLVFLYIRFLIFKMHIFINYDIWMCKIPCEIENIVPRRLHFVDILQESYLQFENYEQRKVR